MTTLEKAGQLLAQLRRRRCEKHLQLFGWKRDGGGGYVSPSGGRRVDLSGDSGYVWELQRFDDSDRDGVATARWIAMKPNVEGDTLQDLQAARAALGGR